MIDYQIDGVPLHDPAGRWDLLAATLIAPPLTRALVGVTIPGVDGETPYGATLTAAQLPVKVKIVGDDEDDLLANLAAVTALFVGCRSVARTAPGGALTTAARLASIADPVYLLASEEVQLAAVLQLPKPVWRGAVADWSKPSTVPGVEYQVTTLAGSTAPVDDARVLITGPISQPRVTDINSGEWFDLSATLATGEKALVDCADWSVRRGSTVTLDGGGALASGVLGTSGQPNLGRLTSKMTGFDPRQRTVSVKLTGSGTTTATGLAIRAAKAQAM